MPGFRTFFSGGTLSRAYLVEIELAGLIILTTYVLLIPMVDVGQVLIKWSSKNCSFVVGLQREEYKQAKTIRIALDNLNTDFEKSFYETFSKKEAKTILNRIAFCYTQKYSSWLNMANPGC